MGHVPISERTQALIALSLLQAFVVGAGLAVAGLTPEPRLIPSPPSVAVRALVRPGPAAQSADPAGKIPDPRTLATRLAALSGGPGPAVKAVVIDAATKRVLYDRGARQAATPASTTKLVTSVAALASLGPGHRITTKVVQGGADDIVLVGGGDPTLTARKPQRYGYPQYASLDELARLTADSLIKAGRGRVRVNVDTSLYQGPGTAAGWKPNYLPDGEVAPMSALTVDEGRVRPSDQDRVQDPAGTAVTTFARMLKQHGITASEGRRAKAGSRTLAAVQSPPLSALVEHLLTVSDNDLAEAIFRLVAVKEGQPGSFAGGVKAVGAVLRRLGVAGGVTVNDGSGLSPRNRITPLALANIAALAASGEHPELRAAITGMPVAGFTGTLAAPRYTGRTSAGAGAVRAKTGTLSGVSTLAGVAYDADGRLLAFAFMLGDGKSPVDPARLDLLASALVGCGCSR